MRIVVSDVAPSKKQGGGGKVVKRRREVGFDRWEVGSY